jgi:hypothetical protein
VLSLLLLDAIGRGHSGFHDILTRSTPVRCGLSARRPQYL